jgi:predicted membrane channel-forming protein YqfA (hemolysin III family)
VKRIYFGIIVFIIILFFFFVYTYGWDLFSHFYVAAFFILTIILMYMLSMILLFIFRRKVRKLKDKL